MRILLLLFLTTTLTAQGIRYDVRCTEESEGKTRVVYQASVAGARDFDVVLSDEKFSLKAVFVAEGNGPLDLRARIETRRAAGTSKRGLPLWEEDTQHHRFRVRLGQTIELLPFGKAGPRGLLRLTIVPSRDAAAQPRIDIAKASDAVAVHAYRVPHWYEVRARIDGASASALVFARERARLRIGNEEIAIAAEPAPYRDAWQATLVKFAGRPTGGAVWEGVADGRPLRYAIGNGRTLILEIQPKE